MAVSSISSAPSVRVLDGWRYLLSPLNPPLGCQRVWRAGWTCHADVVPPWQAVSSLLAVSSVRASAGIAGGMDASYLPTSVSSRVLRKLQDLFAEGFVVVGYVMASVVVTVCFREMLRDVCQKYSLPSPRYGIPVGSDGLISVYVEVEISKGESVAETVRIWGSPFSDVDQSEEDAARRAVAKLRDEYAFEVKDANLEDKKFYENLYARLSVDHTVVCEKYKRLKTDYNLLKGYYNDLLSEKELLVAKRRELMGNIEKCSDIFRRPSIRAVHPTSSGEGSGEDPATPSGYRN
uniref:Uncharacterized protein n=1 Tax=Ananas comosus var. bracteatus TaxID=296719 RepID=A0A6V7PGL4_ANACO|nr:unnamed protein product [Ananas comosus var. bracteatus]